MPNCFQLLREGVAVPLATVDEEMCAHFGEPCDPDRYFRSWYSCVGWDLSMGRTYDQIREIYADPSWAEYGILPVVEWLAANFTPRSWYEPSHQRDR
jgi:hypothetical protein